MEKWTSALRLNSVGEHKGPIVGSAERAMPSLCAANHAAVLAPGPDFGNTRAANTPCPSGKFRWHKQGGIRCVRRRMKALSLAGWSQITRRVRARLWCVAPYTPSGAMCNLISSNFVFSSACEPMDSVWSAGGFVNLSQITAWWCKEISRFGVGDERIFVYNTREENCSACNLISASFEMHFTRSSTECTGLWNFSYNFANVVNTFKSENNNKKQN